ncbi:DUF4097 family beta strand repeat-containing protein [Actinoplanes sp. NBRC 101535]|uniref:DUF4097 family beta strand repeat-containing protein n=1 Tax=Actinoplanes sp. NBRC 101535 TaxID=3032196 RepID=UPI0024A23E7F|nr:DUF4097 family beta strand repeat-containing protein [Actinoplanes sp. NBRC 101535]GLY01517.1 hypothetical protein Acsp01_18960 [Actinoplanes sp. NBRC 101535]
MSRRAALILTSALVLAGCDQAVGARMIFNDTETTKVTDIVLTGGNGDVRVRTGTEATTKVQRVVTGGTSPGSSYTLKDGVLSLTTDCGSDCRVSYEIEAPAGVTVRGEMRSGDVFLTQVGPVDLKLTSGDVAVEDATSDVAVRSTSGDISVTGGGAASLETTNGDIVALGTTGPMTARSTSGDIALNLASASSVTATVANGDIEVFVPRGDYRISAQSAHGEATVMDLADDPKAANTLNLRASNGDITVTGR